MIKLKELADFISGTPQFRIVEGTDKQAPIYSIYSQWDLQDDLVDIISNKKNTKKIRTADQNITTVVSGDVLFSFISGTASIVREAHTGYLYTRNYVKIMAHKEIDPKFLVYCLNENKDVKRQFSLSLQGSAVARYTLKQLTEIRLLPIPTFEKQKAIGEVYFKAQRVEALKIRIAKLCKLQTLKKLEEEMKV